MLKLRYIPALIIFALFPFGAAASPAPTPTPIQLLEQRVETIERAEDTEVRQNEREDLLAQNSMGLSARRMLWPAWLQAVTSILAVGGLVGSLIYSARVHRDNQKSSERQLRAYLGVTSTKFRDLEVGGRLQAVTTTKNFGQTPAYKLKESMAVLIMENGTTAPIDMKEVGAGICVNPGGSHGTFRKLDQPLTQEQFDLITAPAPVNGGPKWVVVVRGVTEYTDAFGVQRFVYFESGHWGPGLQGHVLTPGRNYVT